MPPGMPVTVHVRTSSTTATVSLARTDHTAGSNRHFHGPSGCSTAPPGVGSVTEALSGPRDRGGVGVPLGGMLPLSHLVEAVCQQDSHAAPPVPGEPGRQAP
ncbi:hypothetical protein C1A38_05335 [Verrucosispora sp. ts21]|nr:hypothetical protein C1A38_05335 [Verrucosispora sp. ts21]